MNYFDYEKNVNDYISRTEGHDGKGLIEILHNYLPYNSTVLELGMGPGSDLDILSRRYQVTGSDTSKPFIDRYRDMHKDSDLLILDAISIDTNKKFDCIYSHKVLHYFTDEELSQSFKRQHQVLENEGILCHSFWYGDKVEEHLGRLIYYHTEENIKNIIRNNFDILKMERYEEIEKDDCIYVILKKTLTS